MTADHWNTLPWSGGRMTAISGCQQPGSGLIQIEEAVLMLLQVRTGNGRRYGTFHDITDDLRLGISTPQ